MLRISEIFYSIQGEGSRAGHPSVFIRVFGCNFRCPGFGMPKGQASTEPDEIVNEVLANPDKYPTYESLPLAKTGCDSYPSWHPKLRDYSPELSHEQIIERIDSVIPKSANKRRIDIVFTGGEPLLKCNQREILDLISKNKKYFMEFDSFTFETNGTQKVADEIKEVFSADIFRPLIISISPKLSCSGVPTSKAIKPDVISDIFDSVWNNGISHTYLKFVVNPEFIEDQLAEIEYVLQSIHTTHNVDIPVYLMPEGGTEERYNENMKKVAMIAMDKGYRFCPRLHVTLFGNSWAS